MGALFVDLDRPGAELAWDGQVLDLREVAGLDWRRAEHTGTNRLAYDIFLAYVAAGAAADGPFMTDDLPLLPLFQRQITELLVESLTPATWLRRALRKLQPDRADATDASLAALRWAARDLSLPVPPAKELGASPAFLRLVNLARHLFYVPRLAAQKRRWFDPIPAPGRRRALFVVNYPNHVPSLLPLMRRLQERGVTVVAAGADTATRRRGDVDPAPLRQAGIPYLPFDGAASARELVAALVWSLRLAERLGDALRNPGFAALLDLDGSTRDLVMGPLADLVRARLPKVALYWRLAGALLRRLDPDLLVVTDETLPLLGRVALRAGQARGVPTLTVQHGLMLDDPMYYGDAVADRVALWGEAARNFLVAHGCPPQKLTVVGSTRFDRPPPSGPAPDLAAQLGLPPGTPVVLFTSQPGGRDVAPAANEATLLALARAVAALDRGHLLLKPHPAQSVAELAQWRAALEAAGLAERVTVRRDLPLHPVMRGAALCASVFSTTGLEALWLDRPLLTINLTDRPDPVPYVASGAAVGAYAAAEVPARLRQALDPIDQAARAPARRAFVAEHLGPGDGGAVDRLAKLAADLMAA